MKNRLIAGVFILFLAVIWGTAYASGPLDPCGLLSKEEVETLIGEPVKNPEPKDSSNPLGQKLCLYSAVSSSRLVQISIIRTADMAPGVRGHAQSAPKVYNTTKEMLDPVEHVPGIGDDACWGTLGLHILKGDMYILISVGNTSKRENLELARRIAGLVLPRL